MTGVVSGRRAFWAFFVLSHGWSWTFWWLAAALAQGPVWNSRWVVLIYLGGVGPTLAGLVMTGLVSGAPGLRELARSVVDWRRISLGWLALILFLPLAITLLAAGVIQLIGPSIPPLSLRPFIAYLGQPLEFLALLGFLFLLGPFPEEIGWRGFAQARMQERWTPLHSAVLIGALWGLWHVPLFFVEGYYWSGQPDILRFFVDIIMTSVIVAWVFNKTGQSVLAAILFHFAVNVTGEFFPVSSETDIVRSVVLVGVVILVLRRYGRGLGFRDPISME